jgi:transposase
VAAAHASAKPDLSAIEAELRRMDISDEALRLVLGLLSSMATQNQALQHRLETALRQLWNRKSEKVSPEQLALFLARLPVEDAARAAVAGTAPSDSAQAASSEAPASEPEAAPAPQPSSRRRAGKRAFPADLPRKTEDVRVPEAERRCPGCGNERICIGYETQTLWDFEPAQFFLHERRREKLACKACEEQGVVTAPAPGKPIEGGRPGPGTLAQIVTAKERDGLPLYRQSQIYERGGIHLAPSTLGDWHAAAADLMEPIWRYLRGDTLGNSYLISLDDTPLPVLDREDARGIKKGHLWTYIGDERRVAFCDFTPTWSGTEPVRLLKQFQGRVIQSDGYAGIAEAFSGPKPPQRAGCMDHCRRRFVKALEAGDLRAAVPVKLFSDLYDVERQARLEQLDADALCARRRERSRPVLERLRQVVAELHRAAVPKSPLGKATTYAVNQWATLQVFVDDGRVPMANAHVERQQRRTALGRNAYLFAGNDHGARRLAVLQTMVVNCDLLGVSVWHYLRDTFTRLADGWPQSRLVELTPAAWAAHQKAQQTHAQ